MSFTRGRFPACPVPSVNRSNRTRAGRRPRSTCSRLRGGRKPGGSCSPHPAAPTATRSSSPSTRRCFHTPLSPYAAGKLAGEHYVSVYARTMGLDGVSLRYFNIFGPRQDPSSPYSGVISLFIKFMAQGQRPTIHGDGQQTRDFTYVANVVAANLAALRARNLSWARSSMSALAIASACSTWSPRSTRFWEQTSNPSFKTRGPVTSTTRWPVWTGFRASWATNRSSRSRRDCGAPSNRWSARPANHRVLTPGSRRAEAREVANRRLGDGCRARPDEKEKSLPGPALGRLGAEESAPFPRGQVGLGGPQNQGVGLGSDLARGDCARARPAAGHEQRPRLLPGRARTSTGSERLEPVGRQTSERRPVRRRACPSARAEVSSPAVPTAPGCAERSALGPASRSAALTRTCSRMTSVVHEACSAASSNAGRTVRPARSTGRAISICCPSSRRRTGDQDVLALGRGDPGHGPIESKCPPLGLGRDERLGTEPPRGRELGERPTVANALPAAMARSHSRAAGRSTAPSSLRTAASCCERTKTAVKLPEASSRIALQQ